MLLAKSTNLNNFNSYCSTLTSNGFVEYSKRDNVNGNYFRTYTKGTMALTVYFSKRNSTVRIISGPLTDIPPKDTSAAKETMHKLKITVKTIKKLNTFFTLKRPFYIFLYIHNKLCKQLKACLTKCRV